MIINTRIPLEPNSQTLINAKNTIIYTLGLDWNPLESPKTSTMIAEAIEHCEEACLKLFTDRNPKQFAFYFFGQKSVRRKSQIKSTNPFERLDYLYLPRENSKDTKLVKNTSFPQLILQHCLLSSYHAIITDCLGDHGLSSYAIINKVKSSGPGFLLKNACTKAASGNLKLKSTLLQDGSQDEDGTISTASSRASDFNKTSKNFFKEAAPFYCLKDFFIFCEKSNDTNSSNSSQKTQALQYQASFAGLFYKLHLLGISEWKQLIRPVNRLSEIDIFINHAKELSNILSHELLPSSKRKASETFESKHCDFFNSSVLNSMDRLYYYYLTERLFNFESFFCILQNMASIIDFDLCSTEMINVFFSCLELPNALNRHYFLQYAFYHLTARSNSSEDFWNHFVYPFPSDKRKGLHSTRDFPMGFDIHLWSKQFKLFCNYLGKYIIPVYEWYFLLLLLDGIEKIYPDKTHFERLQELAKILEEYVESNYEKILHPFALHNTNDFVDLLTPYTIGDIKKNISINNFNKLTSTFFNSSKDRELNLPELTPALYRSYRNGKFDSNNDRFRSFFITLARDSILNPDA